jgi:hypothetical protein
MWMVRPAHAVWGEQRATVVMSISTSRLWRVGHVTPSTVLAGRYWTAAWPHAGMLRFHATASHRVSSAGTRCEVRAPTLSAR